MKKLRPLAGSALLFVLAVSTGCVSARLRDARASSGPDYSRPFEITLAQYCVPVAAGLAMPGAVGGWDDKPTGDRFFRGWTGRPVVRDTDGGFVNYVLHPLEGSETHVLARNHGYTFWEAALFDLFASASWEYVFENVFERPSKQDLMVTAPVGCLIGELRYQLKEAGILPGLMDTLRTHAEPFVGVNGDRIMWGIQFRF